MGDTRMLAAGKTCPVRDKWRQCSREAGHDGLHDCGYSFAGMLQKLGDDKHTGPVTVHFLHGTPKAIDVPTRFLFDSGL